MGKIFKALGLGLALLLAVLLGRTYLLPSKIPNVSESSNQAIKLDAELLAKRLSGAVQIPTISYRDRAKEDRAKFIELRQYYQSQFPLLHANLKHEVIGEDSLLYEWTGSDKAAQPYAFLGHQDVVPVEPGTEKDWTHPPFSGAVAEGFIWGRGTLDDKITVVGLMEAVEALLAAGYQPKRTVYFAFGADEEVSGENGARLIAETLKSRNIKLDFTIDEGGTILTGILPGLVRPVALVGLAEKGYLTVELRAKGQGGHSSMPPPSTSIGELAAVLARLEENQMPASVSGPSRALFEYVGPDAGFPFNLVYNNLWLFEPILKMKLQKKNSTNAAVRTTTAVTIFNGGTAENVIPQNAVARVNFRIRPGDTVADVLAHVKKQAEGTSIEVSEVGGNDATKVADVEGNGFVSIQKVMASVAKDVVVAPYVVVAATDSKWYQEVAEDNYRFIPMRLDGEDLSRIHGTNERIAIQSYAEAVQVYIELIRTSDQVH